MPDLAAGNVFRRAIRVWRDEGWKSFCFKLLGELGYRRMVLVEHRPDDPIPEFSVPLQIRHDLLKATELDAYLAFRPDADRVEVLRRLHAGDLCFVASSEGKIVSACWTAMRPVHIDFLDCDCELADGDVYIYDKFTAPAYRGKRLGNAVRVQQMRHLRAAGYRRAFGVIVPENRVSMLESIRGGFRPVGMMGRIKIGPWQRRFLKRWQ